MKSAYLDIEIPDELMTLMNTPEGVVEVIPHMELENIIYHNEKVLAQNAVVHITNIPLNEPSHYAFLCSISDSEGRRIETIGESTDATCITKIAKEYPVLMAYKRAFDDAAIKYLGLRKKGTKIYSDIQFDEDITNTPTENVPTEKPQEVFGAAPIESSENTQKAPKKAPGRPGRPKKSPEKEENKEQPIFSAPPIGVEPESLTTEDTVVENMPDKPQEVAIAENFGAPPLDIDVAETTTDGENKFDVIVNAGICKNKNLTIPQVYERYPSTLSWVINDMTPFTEEDKKLKQLCKEFLDLKQKGETVVNE